MIVDTSDPGVNMFFERVLSKLNEWRETIRIAASVLGADEASVKRSLSSIDAIEEEVLRLTLFYF